MGRDLSPRLERTGVHEQGLPVEEVGREGDTGGRWTGLVKML